MFRALAALLVLLVACREPAEVPDAAPSAPAEAPAEEAPVIPEVAAPADAEPAGEPPAASAAALADGAACLASAECASGVCEGQGCGAEAPGVCMSQMRACTRDRRPYCGCDGVTFFTSGSCPGQRFAARGTCEDPQP